MGDWPATLIRPGFSVISAAGQNSVGPSFLGGGIAFGNTTATWPAANTAFFIPFTLEIPGIPQLMAWENQATVSGNADVGIYDLQGKRLVSTGSKAQSGINTLETQTLAEITLNPGYYFMAMALDNLLGIVRNAPALLPALAVGVQKMVSAFPLPETATLASITTGFVPLLSVGFNPVM